MSLVILEIAVLLLLILVNGVLAMSEIALVSARKARLKQWADSGDRGAQRALTLVSDPSRFFATVQIGITLVGILAGAVGGATLAANLGDWLTSFPALAPYAQALGMIAVVAVITYFTLVLGELVPKRVALIHAERIAVRVAPAMQALARIAAPVVSLLDVSTEGMLRLLGLRDVKAAPVTDEEIALLLRSGAEAGVFEPIEEEIVRHLFRLSDQRVAALITPRTEIVWLDPDEPAGEIRRKIMDAGHSRYPVARGDLDNVIGQALVKDLMAQEWRGDILDVMAVLQPVPFIPETVPALAVLDSFRKDRSKLALVIDEFGGLLGLVTVNDLVEAMVGDLPEIGEEETVEAVQREDGSWLIDGLFPVAEFQDLFGLEDLSAEGERFYQTVGGLVMAKLDRVPVAGDVFEWRGLRIEVLDMDGRRVDKVLTTVVETGEEV